MCCSSLRWTSSASSTTGPAAASTKTCRGERRPSTSIRHRYRHAPEHRDERPAFDGCRPSLRVRFLGSLIVGRKSSPIDRSHGDGGLDNVAAHRRERSAGGSRTRRGSSPRTARARSAGRPATTGRRAAPRSRILVLCDALRLQNAGRVAREPRVLLVQLPPDPTTCPTTLSREACGSTAQWLRSFSGAGRIPSRPRQHRSASARLRTIASHRRIQEWA